MGTSEVCDVSLERVSDYDSVDHKALHLISHMLYQLFHSAFLGVRYCIHLP